MSETKTCNNCTHAGEEFKLGGTTHQHCEHPKHLETHQKGELHPMDTVMAFDDTCNDHKSKSEQICYKSNEVCKYDCAGLCKESV